MTLRALDTRARLKGVHTLGLGASYSLSLPLMHLLSRGGKFIVTPRVPRDRRRQALTGAFDEYARSVRLRQLFDGKPSTGKPFDPRYHVPNPDWQPPRAAPFIEEELARLSAAIARVHDTPAQRAVNCSADQRAALEALAADHDIVVKPADKNLGLTLIGRSWYMAECERQLGDAAVYQRAYGVPLAAIQNRVIRFITAMPLPPNERKWLLAETRQRTQLPQFYIMPKLHKNPVKGRPIVASHKWCTWPLSRWIADKLNSIAAGQPTVLTGTHQLINRLQHIQLDAGARVVLSSADVESLYTSIPVPDAIRAVRERLHAAARSREELSAADIIIKALELVLRLNFLEFAGAAYHQIRGLAMGTPCAPPVANLFLANLEVCVPRPLLYLRFLDDILTVQVVDDAHPEHVLWERLHAMHPSIRLTCLHSPHSVDFLDLQIYREGDRLLHRVHQKVLNKYLYISPRSCHPLHVIEGFVRTELIRYARNSSTELDFLRICRAFSNRLRERGFHPRFLRHVFATVAYEHHAVRGVRERPMVFKALYTGRESSDELRRVLREWYSTASRAFRDKVAKPVLCHLNGKNIYQTLVRAKVPT